MFLTWVSVTPNSALLELLFAVPFKAYALDQLDKPDNVASAMAAVTVEKPLFLGSHRKMVFCPREMDGGLRIPCRNCEAQSADR